MFIRKIAENIYQVLKSHLIKQGINRVTFFWGSWLPVHGILRDFLYIIYHNVVMFWDTFITKLTSKTNILFKKCLLLLMCILPTGELIP